MGSGTFSASTFRTYTKNTKARGISADGKADLKGLSVQDIYSARSVDPSLRITSDTMRECRDTDEHPCTVPVILALDVTGSMGDAAMEVASALGKVMTDLYKSVKDVEFLIMAIGDFAYDKGPVQVSQFESDIRIAEHLDKIWFESGGGGNCYESYTAAWYVGARHTDLDCWKRGAKGLIITIGDEQLNPYLPCENMLFIIPGDTAQANIETRDLREEVRDKYDVAHIHVNHGSGSASRVADVQSTCAQYDVPFRACSVDNIGDTIVALVKEHAGQQQPLGIATSVDDKPIVDPATCHDEPTDAGDITW